jgi:hypothetical protein
MSDPSPSRLMERIMNLLTLIFLVGGIYITIPSAKVLYKIQNAQQWSEAEGTIISAEVQQKFMDERANGQEYLPKIWYSFVVNGVQSLSDRFSFADEFTPSRSAALKLVSDYPAGKKVKVFYDKTDPSFAVLARLGVPWKDCVLAGLGALFAISGLVSFMGIFSRRRV